MYDVFSAHVYSRVDEVVDGVGEGDEVVGLDRGEHRDPELVATELAVGLDIDDPVGAQGGGERGGVDRVGEVDRADDQRALGRVDDERRGDVAGLGPAVEAPGGV